MDERPPEFVERDMLREAALANDIGVFEFEFADEDPVPAPAAIPDQGILLPRVPLLELEETPEEMELLAEPELLWIRLSFCLELAGVGFGRILKEVLLVSKRKKSRANHEWG